MMNIAESVQEHRARWSLAAALLAPPGAAASFVPFRASFTNVGAALVFVALIEGLAIWGRRLGGYVATASAALWFDFFLTPPYERFTISHRPDLETTISLLVVGVVVTELAARSHRHRVRAGTESAHVSMLAAAASATAGSATVEEVLAAASQSLCDALHLRSCQFEVDVSGPPHAQILADGSVVHVGMRWPADEIGIPGPQAEIDCRWRGQTLGRFLLAPTPGEVVSREDRVAAVALVNVVAGLVHDKRHARG
jgi:K+-sensing histidine kinase KdpD